MKNSAKNRWAGEWSEERTARVWAGISGRLPLGPKKAPRARSWTLLAAALVLGASAFFLFVPSGSNVSPKSGTSLVTQSDSLSVALEEGSSLEIGPSSQVRLRELSAEHVGIELEHGSILCEVKPNVQRVFSVRAGDVEVRVVGTKFSVSRQVSVGHSRIEVRVERGLVEVQKGSDKAHVHLLEAGENWVSEENFGQLSAGPPGQKDDVQGDASAATAPAGEKSQEPAPSSSNRPATGSSPGARELLEAASGARREGQLRRAAELYERIVDSHGGDPRAGLAAFELGRLRMDALNEPGGAVQALNKAIGLSPAAGFREDAMARLPRAYANLGQLTECRVAKGAYLRMYPAGLHRMEVTRLCP